MLCSPTTIAVFETGVTRRQCAAVTTNLEDTENMKLKAQDQLN